MMIKIKSSKPTSYIFTGDCVGKSTVTKWTDTLCFTGECPSAIAPSYHRDATPIIYDGDGVKVSALAKIVSNGELVKDSTEIVTIEEATEVTVFFCAETSFVDFDILLC